MILGIATSRRVSLKSCTFITVWRRVVMTKCVIYHHVPDLLLLSLYFLKIKHIFYLPLIVTSTNINVRKTNLQYVNNLFLKFKALVTAYIV